MIGQDQAQIDEVRTLYRIFTMGLVRGWDVAIDGGAHVGTWTMAMAPRFERVTAFEPTPETFGYLCENTAGHSNVECRNDALLDYRGMVNVVQPREKRKRLTSRQVERAADGTIPCVAIDELKLPRCDLIKLDLEGAEGLALKGARLTIMRHKPVLVIEVSDLSKGFGHAPEDIEWQVIDMGYREAFRALVDRVYVPL